MERGRYPVSSSHFPGRGRDAVLARVDVAAGQLPQPPVDDEPVPPDQQHPLGGFVQHDRHRAPRQPHYVLLEGEPARQFQRRDAQPDLGSLIHQAVGANLPPGPFGTLGHRPEATGTPPVMVARCLARSGLGPGWSAL